MKLLLSLFGFLSFVLSVQGQQCGYENIRLIPLRVDLPNGVDSVSLRIELLDEHLLPIQYLSTPLMGSGDQIQKVEDFRKNEPNEFKDVLSRHYPALGNVFLMVINQSLMVDHYSRSNSIRVPLAFVARATFERNGEQDMAFLYLNQPKLLSICKNQGLLYDSENSLELTGIDGEKYEIPDWNLSTKSFNTSRFNPEKLLVIKSYQPSYFDKHKPWELTGFEVRDAENFSLLQKQIFDPSLAVSQNQTKGKGQVQIISTPFSFLQFDAKWQLNQHGGRDIWRDFYLWDEKEKKFEYSKELSSYPNVEANSDVSFNRYIRRISNDSLYLDRYSFSQGDWNFSNTRFIEFIGPSPPISAIKALPDYQLQVIPIVELRPPQTYTHYSIEVPLIQTTSKEAVHVKTDNRSALANVFSRHDSLILRVSDSVWSGMPGIYWRDMDFYLYDSIGGTKTVKLRVAFIGPECERIKNKDRMSFTQVSEFDNQVLETDKYGYPKAYGKVAPDGNTKLGKWNYWNKQRFQTPDTIWNKKVVIGMYNPDSCDFLPQVRMGEKWTEPIYYHLENSQPAFYITRQEDSLRFTCGDCKSWCDLSSLYAPHPDVMVLNFEWICSDALFYVSNGIPSPIDFIEDQYAIFWDWNVFEEIYSHDIDPRDSAINEYEARWPQTHFYQDSDNGTYFFSSADSDFDLEVLIRDKRIRAISHQVRSGDGFPVQFDDMLYLKFETKEQRESLLERCSNYNIEQDLSQRPFGSYFPFRSTRKLLDADYINELNRLSKDYPGVLYELNWYSRIELDEIIEAE